MTFKEELEKDLQDAERACEEIRSNFVFIEEEYTFFINYVEKLKEILNVLKEYDMTKYQAIFNSIKMFGDYKVVGEDISYIVFVDDVHKEIILQFEESDSKIDWVHNFLFVPWRLKLDNKYVWTTYGYACAYKSTNGIPLNRFIEEIKKHPDYKRIIRGWSFGSAMTKIALRHYIIRMGHDLPINEVITYGDVKCWFNPFWRFKLPRYVDKVNEFVTVNDIVTWCVPFFWRTHKSKVGDKFSFSKITHPEVYHTSYELYDYSKYE